MDENLNKENKEIEFIMDYYSSINDEPIKNFEINIFNSKFLLKSCKFIDEINKFTYDIIIQFLEFLNNNKIKEIYLLEFKSNINEIVNFLESNNIKFEIQFFDKLLLINELLFKIFNQFKFESDNNHIYQFIWDFVLKNKIDIFQEESQLVSLKNNSLINEDIVNLYSNKKKRIKKRINSMEFDARIKLDSLNLKEKNNDNCINDFDPNMDYINKSDDLNSIMSNEAENEDFEEEIIQIDVDNYENEYSENKNYNLEEKMIFEPLKNKGSNEDLDNIENNIYIKDYNNSLENKIILEDSNSENKDTKSIDIKEIKIKENFDEINNLLKNLLEELKLINENNIFDNIINTIGKITFNEDNNLIEHFNLLINEVNLIITSFKEEIADNFILRFWVCIILFNYLESVKNQINIILNTLDNHKIIENNLLIKFLNLIKDNFFTKIQNNLKDSGIILYTSEQLKDYLINTYNENKTNDINILLNNLKNKYFIINKDWINIKNSSLNSSNKNKFILSSVLIEDSIQRRNTFEDINDSKINRNEDFYKKEFQISEENKLYKIKFNDLELNKNIDEEDEFSIVYKFSNFIKKNQKFIENIIEIQNCLILIKYYKFGKEKKLIFLNQFYNSNNPNYYIILEKFFIILFNGYDNLRKINMVDILQLFYKFPLIINEFKNKKSDEKYIVI